MKYLCLYRHVIITFYFVRTKRNWNETRCTYGPRSIPKGSFTSNGILYQRKKIFNLESFDYAKICDKKEW